MDKNLNNLFIEELGQELSIEELNNVSGGGGKGKDMTTMAVGEEDDPITTMAVGEEDDVTTLALGEE